MIISKAIKGTTPEEIEAEENARRTPKFLRPVVDWILEHTYYPVESVFCRYYERISRSLAFARHGWMHYDFESAYLYDIMAFKLKRIYSVLETGHAIQEDEDMAALKEAIEICERLYKGNYEDKHYDAHSEKWGELVHESNPVFDEDGKIKWHTCELSRPKATTEAEKAEELADLRKVWEKTEIDRKADIDRLAEILKKHEPAWWD